MPKGHILWPPTLLPPKWTSYSRAKLLSYFLTFQSFSRFRFSVFCFTVKRAIIVNGKDHPRTRGGRSHPMASVAWRFGRWTSAQTCRRLCGPCFVPPFCFLDVLPRPRRHQRWRVRPPHLALGEATTALRNRLLNESDTRSVASSL